MDAAAAELCERFGSEFDRYGLSRTLGRAFGYLFLQTEPVPLQRIAADLGCSRATASTTMRQAVLAAIAEKTHRPADRQDYYVLRPRIWQDSTAAKLHALYVWKAHVEAYRQAAGALDPALAARLAEMTDFFTFLQERFATLVADYEAWRARRGMGGDGGAGAGDRGR